VLESLVGSGGSKQVILKGRSHLLPFSGRKYERFRHIDGTEHFSLALTLLALLERDCSLALDQRVLLPLLLVLFIVQIIGVGRLLSFFRITLIPYPLGRLRLCYFWKVAFPLISREEDQLGRGLEVKVLGALSPKHCHLASY